MKPEYVVWVDPKNQIASFHREEGYDRMEFTERTAFLAYLIGLTDQRFRFQ